MTISDSLYNRLTAMACEYSIAKAGAWYFLFDGEFSRFDPYVTEMVKWFNAQIDNVCNRMTAAVVIWFDL